MYKPFINTVLVEIVVDEWAPATKTESEGMLGRSYREGTVVEVGKLISSEDYDRFTTEEMVPIIEALTGKEIMFNEGVEAGTVFEDEGKTYGFIYWWDIRGAKT